MKLTEPQRRMLRLMENGRSHERWRLLIDSGSHNSGYRVLEGLCGKGLATNEGGYDGNVWIKITEAGRAALAQSST